MRTLLIQIYINSSKSGGIIEIISSMRVKLDVKVGSGLGKDQRLREDSRTRILRYLVGGLS